MNTAVKRLVFVALTALIMAAPAQGQETGESCAAVADDAARLACYDGIFRTDAPASPEGGLSYQSERLIPARPSGREPATLTVGCEAGQARVSFGFAGQLVSATGDIAPLTLQVDQRQTQVRTMQSTDGNTRLTFGSQRETEAFLDSLGGGRSLEVRVTPIGQRSLTVNFRLNEALAEIQALRDSCR
jgi:type VI secretion system protein VasI